MQFWNVFIKYQNPNPLYQDYDTASSALRDTLEHIDVTKRLMTTYPEHFSLVMIRLRPWKGLQGWEIGLYITITHNRDNPFATTASSVADGLPDKGLSPYGVEAIKKMNRIGMMVDISHVSLKTMHDVLDIARAPVIFSHSSAYSKYVGLGSDFDRIPEVPKGLEDVSKYPDLLKKVMVAGTTDEQVRGLMGGNLPRIWKKNEAVAAKLQAVGITPVEASWEGRTWRKWDGGLSELFLGHSDKKKQ
ncbi:Metallo-dependent hydrolase [Nadsonia fulvescens var. elongata DSM 6958]|uniref:Dipeptidase n=1 Tax=Nadsonia fulvescens var. elongata DSM 6958 TaxID=857566 RepID=A0A1E3PG70_9ASCO|nr:Metallo-dependent hydrolase [Nadsonia fulvescens var. elongata DSM 6958]